MSGSMGENTQAASFRALWDVSFVRIELTKKFSETIMYYSVKSSEFHEEISSDSLSFYKEGK